MTPSLQARTTAEDCESRSVSDPIRYPFPIIPEAGGVVAVAPGILWVRMPLPFALDHINLWLLREGDGWTVVDCGYGNEAVQHLWEQLFADHLGGLPVVRIIATHYHPDHMGSAAWLTQRFGVELWTTQGEFLTAHAVWGGSATHSSESIRTLFTKHGLGGEGLETFAARGNVYRRGVPELPGAYRRFMDGDAILMGGHGWQVICGYGHSPEHAALYSSELGILISGDMVLPRISTNVSVWPAEPEGDPLGLFLASLERYRRLPADTLVLPSHGKPFRGIRERIDTLFQHHRERLDLIAAACSEPRTAEDLLPVLFRRSLDAYQIFFAMGESIAHLNHLMHEGVLQRVLGDDGVYRFLRKNPSAGSFPIHRKD